MLGLAWRLLRFHFSGIGRGAKGRDRVKIAILIALRLLAPWWELLRRLGVSLPSPLNLVGWYRLRDSHGVWEVHASGGPVWLTPQFADDGVAAILDAMQPGVLIDVGANCGYYAVRAARHLGDRGRVLAIEAHPVRYEELRRSLALNGLANIDTVWCAAGASDGTATLHEVPFALGHTEPSIHGEGRALSVPLRSLDSVCAERGLHGVRLVKIDVEGFEPAVLRGMTAILSRDRPMVVFEALDFPHLAECTAALREHGYHITPVTSADYLAVVADGVSLVTDQRSQEPCGNSRPDLGEGRSVMEEQSR